MVVKAATLPAVVTRQTRPFLKVPQVQHYHAGAMAEIR